MKAKKRILLSGFLIFGLITLIIPMSACEYYTYYFQEEKVLEVQLNLENFEFNKKKFIEYYQSDFTSETNNDYVNAIVVFNDDIDWNFPDLIIDYRYKYLNGFKANITLELFNYLKQNDCTKYVYEEPYFNIRLDSNDDLHWGVDHTEADWVWGGAEGAEDVVFGNHAGEGIKVAVMDSLILLNYGWILNSSHMVLLIIIESKLTIMVLQVLMHTGQGMLDGKIEQSFSISKQLHHIM